MMKRLSAVVVSSFVLVTGCNCGREASPLDGGIEDGGTSSLLFDAGVVKVKVTVIGEGRVELGEVGCGVDGGACEVTMAPGTVTLRATAAAGNGFTRWECGGAVTIEPVLVLTVTSDVVCNAVFVRTTGTLSVEVTDGDGGTGGVVTSSLGGIACGTGLRNCAAEVDAGTGVELRASADPHDVFIGWEGDCSGGDAGVLVVVEGDKRCVARFRPQTHLLTVTVVGSGSVTSVPAGVDTGAGALVAAFEWGAAVTLTATPNTGPQEISFVGWSGDCNGSTPTTTVTLDGAKSCTAMFSVTPYDLTVAVAPVEGGAVTGKLDGAGADVIICGGRATDCRELEIPSSHSVTLVASAAAGYRLVGWSGCSTSSAATLVVPMTSNRACVATFVRRWTASVSALSGPGSVIFDRSSTGVGVDLTCAAAGCGGEVDSTETVTVTAVPGNASTIVESFTCTAGTKTGATYSIVNPTGDVSCAVTFHQQYSVGVTVTGARGTVASVPRGISGCSATGGACSGLFLSGASVVLTATPAPDEQVSWAASGGGTCDGNVSNGAGQAKVMTFASLDGAKDCLVRFNAIEVTVNGVASAAEAGTVTPATSTINSGSSVTLAATSASNYHLGSWRGAFTSGSGTAIGCTGSAASVTVSVSGASEGAVYACTASFLVNRITVNGIAGAGGEVSPVTTALVSGGAGVTLTAGPSRGYRLLSWSGAFSRGSGTATGCTGTAGTVPVSISGATDGAVYDCTATFLPQSVVTVRVVPAPSASSSFGLVSSPCTIAAGSSTCSVVVDTGTSVTLTTTEVKNAGGANISRFVKWACTNGTSSTVRTATTTIGAGTTCVAQYYGLWSRYYDVSVGSSDGNPNAAPLAPGASGWVPTSSSTFLLDSVDWPARASGNPIYLAGLLAADDESGGPMYTDWASPELGGFSSRISSNGDDTPALVGYVYSQSNRTRGLFGNYQVSRDANGVVNGFSQSTFSEFYYTDPPPLPPALTYSFDTRFLSGRENAARRHVLGGLRTYGVHYAPPGVAIHTSYQNSGWVVLTDSVGAPSASALLFVPGTVSGTTCSTPYTTSINDVLWDPDPANSGGVVVVGEYADVPNCVLGAPCPPPGNHLQGFIAKLDSSLGLVSMRTLTSSANVAGAFTASGLVDNLAHTGYVVFGQETMTSAASGVTSSYVGVIGLSYDLTTMTMQNGYAASDAAAVNTASQTSFNDAIVDRAANRYLVLASAASGDVVIMSFDSTGAPIATDGWRFGTPGLAESGFRLVQPSEGGFLFTGYGATAAGTRATSSWITRTDENFNVPFNGAAPGDRRIAPLVYARPVSLGLLAGRPFSCAGWVDNTLPIQATFSTVHRSFNPVENIQAP